MYKPGDVSLEIVVAKNAGFCFGVSKSIELLFDLLENTDEKLYTIGPIIHNDQVVEKLRTMGVQVVKDISEVGSDGQVVIRTHGVTSGVTPWVLITT